MGIKDLYSVKAIDSSETKEWLLYKHYAHRIPQISFAYGLYKNNILEGICTFGSPCRMLNNGYSCFKEGFSIDLYELNRLCINEGLEKNVLSFFVSQSLSLMPKPCCLVSYADGNVNHHGFIYQATNWIYTGITAKETIYINTKNGKILHPRTVVSLFGSREKDNLPDYIKLLTESYGKYRYFQFLGSKKQVKDMKVNFIYPILPYPKGDNKRYDASYIPTIQVNLI